MFFRIACVEIKLNKRFGICSKLDLCSSRRAFSYTSDQLQNDTNDHYRFEHNKLKSIDLDLLSSLLLCHKY